MSDSENKIKKDQIDFLTTIKPMLKPDFSPVVMQKKEVTQKDEFVAKLNELTQRISVIEEKMNDENEKEDGVRKNKVKEQIISLLKQHKKLSSYELSNLVNLSRTRCNEYFRELLKEGLTEGVIIGKQKYYKLVKK